MDGLRNVFVWTMIFDEIRIKILIELLFYRVEIMLFIKGLFFLFEKNSREEKSNS